MHEELLGSPKPKLPKAWQRYQFALLMVVAAIGAGIYVGNLLYGDNSYDVLRRLEQEELRLKEEIDTLKEENALLQKEYFEQKQLQGEMP
ncbi:MAG: septum formation initiator [Campylobacterales bacterium]